MTKLDKSGKWRNNKSWFTTKLSLAVELLSVVLHLRLNW